MIETPRKYRDFLARFGGSNLYGEPNFILVWCESVMERIGVPPQMFGPYMRSWVLAEWSAPEEFGSPRDWDDKLMRQPFPSRGLYFPLQIFREDDGVTAAQLDTDNLNLDVLSRWIWNVLNHKCDSLRKRKTVIEDDRARKELAEVKRLADLLQDAYPPFGRADAVSYRGQDGARSALRARMEKIEKMMPYLRDFRKRIPKGVSVYGPD